MSEQQPGTTDPTDRAFRTATERVAGAPVRWERVDRRVKRRRTIVVVALTSAVLGLAVAIAVLFIAGKTAVDPSYKPFGPATLNVDFGEPTADRGHARLGDYLRQTHQSTRGLTPAELREEGFLFVVSPRLVGYRGERATLRWKLMPVSDETRAEAPSTNYTLPITPGATNSRLRVPVWVSYPPRSGQYRLRVTLADAEGKTIGRANSGVLVVLASSFFTAYRTPSYAAHLPAGWRLAERYKPARSQRRPRYVTRAVSNDGVSVLIDTTRGVRGDPADSARIVERDTRIIPGYRRLVFRKETLGRNRVFEWSYSLRGRRFTDVFLFRAPDGYAILAEGPAHRFQETRVVAREVARSIHPTR